MSCKNKIIKNGNGTTLYINKNDYIAIGKDGEDVMMRAGKTVLTFENWNEFVQVMKKRVASCNVISE